MSLRRRGLVRRLRPGSRPRPPEGLLERLKEDIPSDLFSGEEAQPGSVEGRRSTLPWTVAASLLLMLLAGLVAVRFRGQLEGPVSGRRATSEQAPSAAADEDGGDAGETGAALDAEETRRTESAAEQERSTAPSGLGRDDLRPEPSPSAPQAREAGPRASLRSRQAPPPQPGEAQSLGAEGRESRAPSPAKRERRLGEEPTVSEAAARPARVEAKELSEEDRLQVEEPPLEIERVRWREGRLVVAGRASVDGLVEARLVGTDRVTRLVVEAGSPFELAFDDAAGARSVEVRIVGRDARWEHDVPPR